MIKVSWAGFARRLARDNPDLSWINGGAAE